MSRHWREGAQVDFEEKLLLKLSSHLALIGAHSPCPEEKRRMFQRRDPGLHLVAGGFSRIVIWRVAFLDHNIVKSNMVSTVLYEVTRLSTAEATSNGLKIVSLILTEMLESVTRVLILV